MVTIATSCEENVLNATWHISNLSLTKCEYDHDWMDSWRLREKRPCRQVAVREVAVVSALEVQLPQRRWL
jgi:hypothetical protein